MTTRRSTSATASSIEIMTASFRSIRGYTVIAALCDEIAFWQDATSSAANPDSEILDALRPGDGDGRRRDAAVRFDRLTRSAANCMRAYRKHYGAAHADDPTLVMARPTPAR